MREDIGSVSVVYLDIPCDVMAEPTRLFSDLSRLAIDAKAGVLPSDEVRRFLRFELEVGCPSACS